MQYSFVDSAENFFLRCYIEPVPLYADESRTTVKVERNYVEAGELCIIET